MLRLLQLATLYASLFAAACATVGSTSHAQRRMDERTSALDGWIRSLRGCVERDEIAPDISGDARRRIERFLDATSLHQGEYIFNGLDWVCPIPQSDGTTRHVVFAARFATRHPELHENERIGDVEFVLLEAQRTRFEPSGVGTCPVFPTNSDSECRAERDAIRDTDGDGALELTIRVTRRLFGREGVQRERYIFWTTGRPPSFIVDTHARWPD